jgi:hypothetical protein
VRSLSSQPPLATHNGSEHNPRLDASVNRLARLGQFVRKILGRSVDSSEYIATCPGFQNLDRSLSQQARTFARDSYPQNHTYVADGDRLLAGPKLAARVAQLAQHYPAPLESLVDLSCSKGYFLFHAVSRHACARALGIDLDEQCLCHCHLLNENFDRQKQVRFARMTIEKLADSIDKFGGPFQAMLVVNTYQYLVFGSELAPATGCGHRDLFRQMRQICNGRVIFHNRLEFADLQENVRQRALQSGEGLVYTPAAICDAASEFFKVTILGKLHRRPILLLDARS